MQERRSLLAQSIRRNCANAAAAGSSFAAGSSLPNNTCTVQEGVLLNNTDYADGSGPRAKMSRGRQRLSARARLAHRNPRADAERPSG